MYKGTRTVWRQCLCGCSQYVEPYLSKKTGRVEFYPKFIPGHGNKLRSKNLTKRWKEHPEEHPGWQPIGTRRKHNTGRQIYWVVKVAEFKRWRYEHRVIMERLLGRPLKTKEHVHHRNHNTLDNSEDNLMILSASEHQRTHQLLPPGQWSKHHVACLECGTITKKHLSLGLCTMCYQRQRWVKEYQHKWHQEH